MARIHIGLLVILHVSPREQRKATRPKARDPRVRRLKRDEDGERKRKEVDTRDVTRARCVRALVSCVTKEHVRGVAPLDAQMCVRAPGLHSADLNTRRARNPSR